jgi:phage terminase small subunit
MPLTPKVELFCLEYLVDLNATQATIRAGYSPASAASIGSENLTKPEIASRVHELLQARAERVQVDGDWVLKRLVMIAERCSAPLPAMQMTMAGYVQKKTPEGEGVFEFDALGATKSLELIGKHVGMFEKHNKQKQGDVTITIGGKAPGAPIDSEG